MKKGNKKQNKKHVHKKCTGAGVNYEYHVNFHWQLIFKLPVKLNHLHLRLAGILTKLALPLVHNKCNYEILNHFQRKYSLVHITVNTTIIAG